MSVSLFKSYSMRSLVCLCLVMVAMMGRSALVASSGPLGECCVPLQVEPATAGVCDFDDEWDGSCVPWNPETGVDRCSSRWDQPTGNDCELVQDYSLCRTDEVEVILTLDLVDYSCHSTELECYCEEGNILNTDIGLYDSCGSFLCDNP